MTRRSIGWALLIVVGIVAGAALGYVVTGRVLIAVTLHGQRAQIRLPQTLQTRVRTTRAVRVGLSGTVPVDVPLHQQLPLPLHGAYDASLVMDADIPLQLVIDYHGNVPVHTQATVKGSTDLVVNSTLVPSFPIEVPITLDFQQPVSLRVPVDTTLHLHYDGPVTLHFDQTVSPVLDTVLHTRVAVDRSVDTPIVSAFDVSVQLPQSPQTMVIQRAALQFPLNALRLQAP